MEKRKLKGDPIVIMTAVNKGGCGKTSHTIEMCDVFGQEYKVLGIDLDPQSNFSMYADVDMVNHKNLKDLLDVNYEDVSECIQHVGNYDIIAGSRDLVHANNLYPESDDEYILQETIELLDYDFIFLDTAPAQTVLSIMGYVAADYVIGITEDDDGSIIGLRNVNEDIIKVKKRRNRKLKLLGIVMNKYERSNISTVAYEELIDLAEEFGTTVFDTKIRKSKKSSEAKTMRQSVTMYDKRNNIALDEAELKKEIIKRIKNDGRM